MIKLEIFEQLNDAQKLAVFNPINSCTKIVAGAGCGKTKVISSRFLKLTLDLIQNGEASPLEKILVITFTDKAANEMKERIYSALAAGSVDYYSQNLWVSTFHSFCSKILRKHSIEVGLAPDFTLGDALELKNIYDEIIEKIKNSACSEIKNLEKIASNLGVNKNILEVENLKSLGVVGDLENIFETIYNVIKKIKSLGISPSEFLKKTIIAQENFSKTVETLPFKFSSKEDYISAWQGHLADYRDDFCDFDLAFKKICDQKLIITKNGSKKAESWGFAEGFPDNIYEINKIELFLTKTIALVYAVYENELLLKSVIDFDDLINKAIKILQNSNEIREYYQNQFSHIIIDEFQDTNGAQLELIKLLLDENNANITFVGDRKQSIYGFRHAQMENLEVLHNFIEQKYNKKFPEIMLNTNYRSTPEVLGAVNALTLNFLNLDEKLFPNPCFKENEEKMVFKTVFEDVQFAGDLRVSQANYIADEIQKLKFQKNPNYSDFAILVNSHSEAEFIEKYLMRAKIPSIKKVNTGFFKSSVVKNLKALLRLAYNKFDEQALIRVLKMGLGDVQLYEIAKILEKELLLKMSKDDYKKLNFAQKFFEVTGEIPYKKKLENVFSSIKKGEKLSSIFYKLISNFPLAQKAGEYEKYRAGVDLKTFEKIVENYEDVRTVTYLGEFIKYLDEISDDVNFELPNMLGKNIDAVNILTVHASKGLEFDYVFLTAITSKTSRGGGENIIFDLQYGKKSGFGVVIGKFKGKDTAKALLYKQIWKNPRAENEKLRLFYVAISRAKKYLNIMAPSEGKNLKPAYYTDVI